MTPSPTALLRSLLLARLRRAARQAPRANEMPEAEARTRLIAATLGDLATRGRLRKRIPVIWSAFKAASAAGQFDLVLPDHCPWGLDDLLQPDPAPLGRVHRALGLASPAARPAFGGDDSLRVSDHPTPGKP